MLSEIALQLLKSGKRNRAAFASRTIFDGTGDRIRTNDTPGMNQGKMAKRTSFYLFKCKPDYWGVLDAILDVALDVKMPV